MPRIRSAAVLGPLFTSAALYAVPTWTVPHVLESRGVVEISQIGFDVAVLTAQAPVLFAGAPNSLEIVLVDTSVDPPGYSTVPVATGNIFALGTFVNKQTDRGFSFVDGSFDVRFGHCPAPCDSATNSPVIAGTFVDSDSGASVNHFWTAALNNSVPRTLSVRTSPDGVAWTPLYSYTPPESAGVCGQYNGCGRINFVVDPTATDVATALSCLTFEVKTSATTTARRIVCFAGAVPQLPVTIDTDVPYSAPVTDRLTDSLLYSFMAETLELYGSYNHRQTQTVRTFLHTPADQQLAGPVELGPAPPPDGNPFGLSSAHVGDGAHRVMWASPGPGQPANDVEWNPSTSTTLSRTPVLDDFGPIANPIVSEAQPAQRFIAALFFQLGTPPPLRGTGSGLAISRYRLPLFDDGFETEDTLRWSATIP
jgi:hypothetical protein